MSFTTMGRAKSVVWRQPGGHRASTILPTRGHHAACPPYWPGWQAVIGRPEAVNTGDYAGPALANGPFSLCSRPSWSSKSQKVVPVPARKGGTRGLFRMNDSLFDKPQKKAKSQKVRAAAASRAPRDLDSWRPRAQSQGRRSRHSARPARGLHRAFPGPANPRSPSTRSMPRASAAMSKACRPMPGSFWK